MLNNSFPEDADYNLIPVESFGLAVLRGCGWKDGEGIGLSNKKYFVLYYKHIFRIKRYFRSFIFYQVDEIIYHFLEFKFLRLL